MITACRDSIDAAPLYQYDGANGSIGSNSVLDLISKGVAPKLDYVGLRSYLEYGCVCEPLTLIRGIKAVPPRINPRDVEVKEWSGADAVQREVTSALEKSVARQMSADENGRLPAAFLSGGIDSSAIVALMRKNAPDDEIRTYCVTHEDARTDERQWARMVADANHTRHTELSLTGDMIGKYIDDAVAGYDQPSLDGINFWFVSKLVSEAGEKIVLSGEGGDELFVGYGRFANQRRCEKWAKRLGWLPSCFGVPFMKFGTSDKIRKFGQLVGCRSDSYFESRRIFDRCTMLSLLKPDIRNEVIKAPSFSQIWDETFGGWSTNDWINSTSWKELTTVLLSMYLHDGYQVSRPFGLEVRTPLIDSSLLELMFSIPGKYKCAPEYLKPLLVRAAGAGLPLECVTRKKQGFTLPFDMYFKGSMKARLDAFLYGGESMLFERDALERIGRAYRDGKVTWSRIWSLFMVDTWCKRNRIEL